MKEELQLLVQLSSLEPEARRHMVFMMPNLLAGGVHELWEELLRDYSGDKSEIEHLQAVFAELSSLRKYLENHPSEYPIGHGPVEKLMDRLEKEEISREQARKLARKLEAVGSISLAYMRALCHLSLDKLYKRCWQYAVDIQMILLAILEDLPDTKAGFECTKETIICALRVASETLSKQPDGDVYKVTVNAAQKLLRRAQDEDNSELIGRLYFRIGTLHLDAYTTGHDISTYQSEKSVVEVKTRTLSDGSQEIYKAPLWGEGMPSAEEALNIATDYLKKSVPFFMGNNRGRVLKALAQALYWRRYALNEPIEDLEIRDACEEALKALDPNSIVHRQYVEQLLKSLGAEVTRTGDDPMDKSVTYYLDQLSPWQVVELVVRAVDTSVRPPEEVLKWLRSARGLLYNTDEQLRLNYWERELVLLCKSILPESISYTSEQELVEEIHAWETQAEKSNSMEGAAQAVLMAHACMLFGCDSQGLRLLNKASLMSPQLEEQASDAFLAMTSYLCSQTAAEFYIKKELSLAAEMNFYAIDGYDRLQLTGFVLKHLVRLVDLFKDWKAASSMINSFISILPGLETRHGQEVAEYTQQICWNVLRIFEKNNALVNHDKMMAVMKGLKGARFSLAMRRWDPAISVHTVDREIIAEIDKLEARLGHDSIQEVYSANGIYDEQMLLSGSIDETGMLEGGSDNERLINLQRNVDRDLARTIYGYKEYEHLAPSFLLNEKEVRAQLDDRTVLINIFWQQEFSDNRIYWHFSVSTSSETQYSVGEYLDEHGRFKVNKQPWIDPLAIDVQHLRHRVKLASGPRMIDRDGALVLEKMYDKIIGDWEDYLHTLHEQGKNHLCFVPHRSLHFFPLHLLGKKGSTLADDWVVSYLPNICFLRGQTVSVKNVPIRSKQLAILGISFAGTGVKTELPQSVSETKSIGNIYGIEPILEDKADSNCLLEAFNQCRYVHLSTHGRHNVIAPAFQSLMMGGGTKVRALDILGQDLKGLELLTLSACETSLGRFDSCDNLTGLPAMLFLSGLQTLIGTMWPVDPTPAETFFTELYKQLHQGQGRLDAFSEAVKVCREEFPQYRHWGAFVFCGAWWDKGRE